MKNIILIIGLLAGYSSLAESHNTGASSERPPSDVKSDEPRITHVDAFYANLLQLCGKKFEGKTVFPDDPKHDFAGKKLVMTVKDCSAKQIRIPFSVGTDHSRTWVFTKTDKGIQLKHDHRHEDGTPDDLTMYGGDSDETGNQWQQSFPADALTYELVPKGKTNVWTIVIDPAKQLFSYRLTRHGKKRYSANFELTPQKK
jgi:hypothetical protein